MPTEDAVAEFHAEYQGHTIYFCCEGCVRKFQANPGPYLANLPPAEMSPTVKVELERPRWLRVWEFCERHGPIILAVIAAFLLVLTLQFSRRESRFLKLFAHRSVYLILLLTGACAILWREMEQAREEAATIQNATAQQQAAAEKSQNVQSGKLLQWAWPQGLHELPKGIRNTYYRGNDERSEKLFNGGNYRTATFHLSVLGSTDAEIESGAKVAGQQLRIRLEIVRAPNTAANFFKADQMAEVFLSPLSEGTKGEIYPLTMTEAERRWSVAVPTGQPRAIGYQRIAGVWAVCVGDTKGGVAGAKVHYYIQAIFHIQDGVMLPESTLWMIPVYPSPILHGPHADGQWFSDRPIPEIPDGKNVTDPKLLGVPEKKTKEKSPHD
ncbi:MAG: YHS domain-containing protein [Planctomycetes bacterium]|nr:YHS domain-containing protein [Planctomycetota bacterium]